MATRERTILFLNHSASRNGASILLLNLLQWLRANSDFKLEVLSDGGGPLIDDFRAVARTRVWRNPLSFLRAFKRPWASALRASLEGPLLRAYLRRRRYDLVYANTAATWPHVASLGRYDGALLWHIHELSYALKLSVGEDRARALLPIASRVVAVSKPVVEALIGQFAVRRDRVDLIHGFVPTQELPAADRLMKRRRILAALGWPADAFVVGACGGLGWRKGTDLFLQMASRLARSDCRSAMHFLWVGGSSKPDAETYQFEHDRLALGLGAACRRIASTADVDDYYCAMDVFALTSREDPFPLVMLEAAMHGLPTLCFDQAGGGPEFVGEDAGVIVPYLDVDAFAAAVVRLHADPLRRQSLGNAARRKVQLNHSVESQGPKLLDSIERCLVAA